MKTVIGWTLACLAGPLSLLQAEPAADPNPTLEGYVITLVDSVATGGARWSASNPAGGFEIVFTDRSVSLSRADAPSTIASLGMVSWGRPQALHAPTAATASVTGPRIEFVRTSIQAWYENRPEGLAQGFTLWPPDPADAPEQIELQMVVDGRVTPRVGNGDSVDLVDDHGVVPFSLVGLTARDALGDPLPATRHVGRGTLSIVVQTEGAILPISVTQTVISPSTVLTGPGFFGSQVAIDGTTLAVSDSGGLAASGSVFVYTHDSGSWELQTQIGPFPTDFGRSIALDGDTLVAGAPGLLSGGTGAVVVYQRTGTTWMQQAVIEPADAMPNDAFGWRVAVSADTLAATGGKAAYVFVRNGSTWTQQAKIPIGGSSANVALSGDTLLLGTVSGTHVLVRAGTSWSLQQTLSPSGATVSLHDVTALIGFPSVDPAAGEARIFHRTGAVWSLQTVLTPSQPASFFGELVAVEGNRAVVAGTAFSPGAEVYTLDDGIWGLQAFLEQTPSSLDVSGDTVVVGSTMLGSGGTVSIYQLPSPAPTSATVTGIVFRLSNGMPIEGVQIATTRSSSAITDADGNYELTELPAGLVTVSVSADGYLPDSRTLELTAGSSSLADFWLTPQPPPGEPFRVLRVDSDHTSPTQFSYFLSGVHCHETFSVTVDWSGRVPGSILWITPTATFEDPWPTGAQSVSREFDMGFQFSNSGTLRVQAVTGDGLFDLSDEYLANLRVIRPPPGVDPDGLWKIPFGTLRYTGPTISTPFSEGAAVIPSVPFFENEPLIFGFEHSRTVEINGDGTGWGEVTAGLPFSPLTAVAGVSFAPTVKGRADWVYEKQGNQWTTTGHLAFGAVAELVASGLIPIRFVLPLTWKAGLHAAWFVEDLDILGWDEDGSLKVAGLLDFDPLAAVELKAAVGWVDQLAVQVGAAGGVKLGATLSPFAFTKATLFLKVVAEIKALLFSLPLYQEEWVEDVLPWVNGHVADSSMTPSGRGPRHPQGLRVQERGYPQASGRSAFLGGSGAVRTSWSTTTDEAVLQTGVYPQSDPALTSVAGIVGMAWLVDDPTRTSLNRTKLVFSWRDEGDVAGWSTPAAIDDDGTADFDPVILGDPATGRIHAAWMNVKEAVRDPLDPGDPAEVDAKFEELKSKAEITVATFDVATESWSGVTTLTDDLALDRSPCLVKASNGPCYLTWIKNPDNDLLGSPSMPNEILMAGNAGAGWGPAFATIPGAPAILQSTAVAFPSPQVAFTTDTDGDLSTTDDQELFSTFGQAFTPLTNDDIADTSLQVLQEDDGTFFVAWRRGDDIVAYPPGNLADPTVLVDGLATHLGNAEFRLLGDGTGNRVLVWTDPAGDGVDVWTVRYDPSHAVWGLPQRLTASDAVESSLAGCLEQGGALVLAYDRTAVSHQVQTLFTGGEAVEVELPVWGLTDLLTLRREPSIDLALLDGSLLIDPPNPGPGTVAGITVTVSNVGDFATTDVPVRVEVNGQVLEDALLAGPLPAGGTGSVTVPWVVPDPAAPQVIQAVVDPRGLLPDVDVSNNAAILEDVVQPDAIIEQIRVDRLGLGDHVFTVRVLNSGGLALPAGASVLLHAGDRDGPVLHTWSLDASLYPGAHRDVSWRWTLDLAAGLPLDQLVTAVVQTAPGTNEFDEDDNTRTARAWEIVQKPLGSVELDQN